MHVFSNPKVDRAATEQALRDNGVEFERDERVQRTWLDTFDLRLTKAGMRLEASAGRTLTTSLFQVAHPPAYLTGEEPPTFAWQLAAGPFRERLADVIGVRALVPIATLRALSRSGTRRNAGGKAIARVTLLDGVTLGDAGGTVLGWAVEVDALLGYEAPNAKLTKALKALGLRRHEGDLFDLAVAESLIKHEPHDPRPQLRFDSGERALPGYRRVLARLFETIEANWDGAARNVDSEFLHDLRVALRRTRSVLANAKGVIAEDQREHFLTEFHRLASATSEPRDLDVFALGWHAAIGRATGVDPDHLAPVYAALLHRRDVAHARLARDLSSARTSKLLHDWEAWLSSSQSADLVKAGLPLRSVVSRRLRRLRSRLRDDEHDMTMEGRHTARKDAKQLRYMVECFGGVYDQEARKAFVKKLSAFQDRLGSAQDARVQAALLKDLLRDGSYSADCLIAAGHLEESIVGRSGTIERQDLRLFTKGVDRKFDALVESGR